MAAIINRLFHRKSEPARPELAIRLAPTTPEEALRLGQFALQFLH